MSGRARPAPAGGGTRTFATFRHRTLSVVVLVAALVAPWPASAHEPGLSPVKPHFGATSSSSTAEKSPEGRPHVRLDQLRFSPSIENPERYEKHLRRILRREARRARWGAGRDNRIEYRFELEQLEFRQEGDVLRVSCRAIGRLPKNKSARSQLTFGGKPSERDKLARQVLEIVARGVITRLAELERRRRGLD